MASLSSIDGNTLESMSAEQMLEYKLLLSEIDRDNQESNSSAFEPYHSSSPCSSESADSYPSSNSYSPADKMNWLCLQQSPCQNLDHSEPIHDCDQVHKFGDDHSLPTDRILSPLDHLDYPSDCDSSFLFADYIDQNLFDTQPNLDSVSADLDPDKMTDRLKNQIASAFQGPDCLNVDDSNDNSVRLGTSPVVRPKTLPINDSGRVQGLITPQQHHQQKQQQSHSEMFCILTSPSTPNELQQQLASADIAWMDALDIPNLSLEEIERILSTVNSLRSPEEESITILGELPKSEDKCILRNTKNIENLEQKSGIELALNSSTNHDCDCTKSVIPNEQVSFTNDQTEIAKSDQLSVQKNGSASGFDSDNTLTCSEAEYYNNKIRHRKIKRIKRSCHRIRDESSDLTGGSETEDDLCWVDSSCQSLNESEIKYRKVGWQSRASCSQSMSRYPSYRRVQNAQADADMEPWWPRGSPKRVTSHIDSSNINGKNIVKNLKTVHKSRSNDLITDPQTNSSGQEDDDDDDDEDMSENDDDEAMSNSDFCRDKVTSRLSKITPRNNRLLQSKHKRRTRQKCSNRTVTTVPWRGHRRPKQMELWQFILCRLETGKQSAFQWVNRSNGVFRIVDTQAGAKEWGSYRNNKRMDYEKMARAMRFYYKDSILRKARQQLHFQFAMSYVEWATKYYESMT